MRRVNLGLAFHSHQPIGNFPWVFSDAYRQAYLPLLEALERHPLVRVSLHYSGCLLDWLFENEPGFVERLAALVQSGQVELMSGGYYEPILSSIPEADRYGQIRKMNSVIGSAFGVKPTGLWLAERVWEPELASQIARCGLSWTILDDAHFASAGLREDQLRGYHLTEDQGYPLKVFPTSQHLRYVIPWRPVEEVIGYLRSVATDDGSAILCMGDDGEKFGSWPESYAHCWENGWMERFFEAVEENGEWLRLAPLGELASEYRALGRVYLPSASYTEMMEWALPAAESYEHKRIVCQLEDSHREDVLQFVRAGFWRNFLTKYDEINFMHKKMLRVHRKVHGRFSNGSKSDGNLPLDDVALNELWKGQCNCPYWHGVFGGSYMADVRTAVQSHLVAAEDVAEREQRASPNWIAVETTDFDLDGRDEVLIEGSEVNAYVSPSFGGSLFQLDWRPARFNLASTMTRRPEAYHRAIIEGGAHLASSANGHDGAERGAKDEPPRACEPDLSKLLIYDWHRRASLLDRFLDVGTSLDSFAESKHHELGDFVDQPYCADVTMPGDGQVQVTLTRDGRVRQRNELVPFSVSKSISMAAGSPVMKVEYRLTNEGALPVDVLFGVEWNLNLLGGGHNDLAYYAVPGEELEDSHLDSRGLVKSVSEVALGNRGLGIEFALTLSKPADLWRFPIETVTSSEGGFERTYQGSCVFPHWRVSLAPGGDWRLAISTACRRPGQVL